MILPERDPWHWSRKRLQDESAGAGAEAVHTLRAVRKYPYGGPFICPDCGAATEDAYLARSNRDLWCACEHSVFDQAREAFLVEERPRVIRDLTKEAGFPARLRNRTLDGYEPRKGTEKALATCREFVDAFGQNAGDGLLLIGSYGTGKTHLAIGVGRALVEDYLADLRFVDAAGIITAVKPAAGEKTFNWAALDRVLAAEVVILDDVGQHETTRFGRDILYRIVHECHGDDKPLIITTNLGDVALKECLGGAAVSRLYEACTPAILTGSDYRAEIARKRRSAP